MRTWVDVIHTIWEGILRHLQTYVILGYILHNINRHLIPITKRITFGHITLYASRQKLISKSGLFQILMN